ncbi:hypothetical protein [Dictyobacter aurantiacus]|uniref:Uncharacterized protein n=1 Tax=Dictyobacter aurantiacus TaxID=1936993 RepID=A0A401Z9T4_9CHLR|nr:hypothetical protein [Dictyobacter aurantiacus]GCE03640.1 hypothetical protein KDAU_09690 [Dictyobacter aurantiacus]
MGIYLGQLPPAEVARLKAELAETLIANFCYPRFFDHRTESLQMRPVDRTKRQEVWLYLSSVDFTAWSRIDLMSTDFQHQIERLFIQFVQRNRNFFGNQGRRRMSDIRLLISSCAAKVAQNLRNHLTGQKPAPGTPPFGSPRPVVSWSTPSISGRSEPTWEQIASSTMLLQQQMQEIRGEARPMATPAAAAVAQPVATPVGVGASSPNQYATNGAARRPAATPSSTSHPSVQQPVRSDVEAPAAKKPVAPQRQNQPVAPAADGRVGSAQPMAAAASATMPPPAARTGRPAETAVPQPGARKLDSLTQPQENKNAAPVNRSTQQPAQTSVTAPTMPVSRQTRTSTGNGTHPPTSPLGETAPAPAVSAPSANPATPAAAPPASPAAPAATRASVPGNFPVAPNSPLTAATSHGNREVMTAGEDDLAIFEQMRHQLVIWLRVEAISAGLEISNQSPTQLLEMLRQHARFDETRLQVVSTLLNLANQVIKTGLVSVLDYKQALMFHLMHTRRQ